MPSITFENILKNFKTKQLQPVYFLHGPESFFIDRVTDKAEDQILTESEKGFNQIIVYGKETDAVALYNICTRYPMMAERQLVIVKEAQDFKGWSAFEKYFEKPVPTTVLIFAHKYKTLDKRQKISKLILDRCQVMESKPIAENKLPAFVNSIAQEKGYTVSEEANRLLVEYIGDNLEILSNAVDRLAAGHADKSTPIPATLVEESIGRSREYNIFDFTRALSQGDTGKLALLTDYFSSHTKEYPMPMLIGALYSFFSKVAALHYSTDKEAALSQLGINAWGAKEYATAAGRFGREAAAILDLLLTYDLRFKGVDDTGTEPADLVRELFYRITHRV